MLLRRAHELAELQSQGGRALESIEDLAQLLALWKPGAYNKDREQAYYDARFAARERPAYAHPDMASVLDSTFGQVLFAVMWTFPAHPIVTRLQLPRLLFHPTGLSRRHLSRSGSSFWARLSRNPHDISRSPRKPPTGRGFHEHILIDATEDKARRRFFQSLMGDQEQRFSSGRVCLDFHKDGAVLMVASLHTEETARKALSRVIAQFSP
jgi:hypothetical protein